jgi:uncharacterized membrane protein
MATSTRAGDRTNPVKWAFFAFMGLCILLVLWVDERFWFNAASDPHLQRIAAYKDLLILHGLGGATALTAGTFQMSSRIRRVRPALHRALGKVYISAVCFSAPIALYIGTGPLEPVTIHVEQVFQAGFWALSALIAWVCIRSNQMALHKAWMMRSYGLTLIFVLARVPDAFMDTEDNPQFLSDMLWSLVIAALIAPEIILTAQTLWRIRSAKARAARAGAAAVPAE